MLALGFFVVVWIALVAIQVLSPNVYAQTLRQVPVDMRTIEMILLAALSALIALLVIGIVRRWRWAFG